MYFDFEGRNFDTPTIESAISWREQVLVAVFGHILVVLLAIFLPRLEFVQNFQEQRLERLAEEAELRAQQQLAMASAENAPFVFIAPRVDLEASEVPRPDAPPSDLDRVAQSPLRTLDAENSLPVAEGNSTEFVESENLDDVADPLAPLELEDDGTDSGEDEVLPEPDDDGTRLVDATTGQEEAEEAPDLVTDDPGAVVGGPSSVGRFADSSLVGLGRGPGDPDPLRLHPELRADGLLGDAVRNLRPSIRRYSFDNPRGNPGRYGGDIQFDSKGIDFGSWIRRFRAQVYRNWILPYRVLTDSGHVVLTFNIHRDGAMTDLSVMQPSRVDPFNHSATNALRLSNPTQPLPTEYPDDQVLFTVTFFFNEIPPDR